MSSVGRLGVVWLLSLAPACVGFVTEPHNRERVDEPFAVRGVVQDAKSFVGLLCGFSQELCDGWCGTFPDHCVLEACTGEVELRVYDPGQSEFVTFETAQANRMDDSAPPPYQCGFAFEDLSIPEQYWQGNTARLQLWSVEPLQSALGFGEKSVVFVAGSADGIDFDCVAENGSETGKCGLELIRFPGQFSKLRG